MKTLISILLVLLFLMADLFCQTLYLNTNNVIQFLWPVYDNANQFQIFYTTNGSLSVTPGTTNITGGSYSTLNLGTNTSITVTNFPLGVSYYYLIGYYSNGVSLGFSQGKPVTAEPTNSIPAILPSITITIIQ